MISSVSHDGIDFDVLECAQLPVAPFSCVSKSCGFLTPLAAGERGGRKLCANLGYGVRQPTTALRSSLYYNHVKPAPLFCENTLARGCIGKMEAFSSGFPRDKLECLKRELGGNVGGLRKVTGRKGTNNWLRHHRRSQLEPRAKQRGSNVKSDEKRSKE